MTPPRLTASSAPGDPGALQPRSGRARSSAVPRGKRRVAVRPQSSSRQTYVCDAAVGGVGLVEQQPARLARRRGRGWPSPGATETTTPRCPPLQTSNSCRSLTAAWWMCPARISSAPASTSAPSTWLRRATGRFRDRHGAPISWWWSSDDASALRRLGQRTGRAGRAGVAQAARLVPPRPHRVEADDAEIVGAVHRLGRLPEALELGPGPREAGRERVGNVVVPGDTSTRSGRGRAGVAAARSCWSRRPAVRQVAGRDDQIRLHALDSGSRRPLDLGSSTAAHVQVGDVKEAYWHRRTRL